MTSYVFVPNNGRGGNAASRKSIRAHAMNESLRQRLAGVKLAGSDGNFQDQLGRFRLADSATKVETKLFKNKKSTKRKTTRDESKSLEVVSKTGIPPEEHVLASTQCVLLTNQQLPSMPSPGRFDPFDTLPIPFERRQQKILSYYETSFHQNSLAFNSDKRMVSLAAFDPAWLHSTFSIIALNLGFAQGIPGGVSLAALFHRGKALELVNQRLCGNPAEIPDTTLGAIASLANFEMIIGSLFTARAHMKGLEYLVRTRDWDGEHGSPVQLRFLRKLLAWADLSYSGMTLGKPLLNSIESTGRPNYHTDTSYHIKPFPVEKLSIKLTDVLDRLRYLTKLTDCGKLTDKQQDFFTSTLFTTQYQLVTFQGKHIFDTNNIPDPYLTDIQNHEKSASLAFLIYINMILRKIPSSSKYHSIFAKHLRSSLQASGDFLTLAWCSNLGLLSWILFIGAIAIGESSDRSYFAHNLALVRGELGLSDVSKFMSLLKGTVWLETFSSPQSATALKEANILLSAFRAQDEMVI